MVNKTTAENSKKWLIGLVIVIIAFGTFVYKDIINSRQNNVLGNKQEVQPAAKYISYQGQDDKTVFELLRKNHNVKFTKSDLGVFITSIDGLENTEKNFWLYYIDGKAGEKAADKFQTKNNQKIEWKYESLPY